MKHYTALLSDVLAQKRFSVCVFTKSGSKLLNLASPDQLDRTWNSFLDEISCYGGDSIVVWFRDFVTVRDRIDKLRDVFTDYLTGKKIGHDEID